MFYRKPFCLTGLLALLGLFTAMGTRAWAADFGDAPDSAPTGYPAGLEQTGSFPTLAGSGGAQVTATGQATLGPTASDEADANDPADPDGMPNLSPSNTDSDDGIVDFVVALTSIPPQAGMTVNVQGQPGGTGGTYWINVLIDMNMNGKWDSAPVSTGVTEWAVRNFPVVVAPGADLDVKLPPFFYGYGNRLPDGAWMRIVLSDKMIADPDWAGGGTFAAGEVEDHVIDLPELGEPPKSFIPAMICPRKVYFPKGAAIGTVVPFSCDIYNLGRDPGTAGYNLTQVTPNVTVAPVNLPPASCAPPGPVVLNCQPTPAIAPAPLGLVAAPVTPHFTASFNATKTGNPLPSRWTYRAWAIDPDAVVTKTGVTIGYGDSTGDVDFLEEPEKEKGRKEK